MNDAISPRLLSALLEATDERRQMALRILEGHSATVSDTKPLLITVADAARLLSVHRSSIWRAISAGRLKKIEIYPGFERLRRADVEALAGGVS